MEVRGNPAITPNGRPPIARRSCDQCRSRKSISLFELRLGKSRLHSQHSRFACSTEAEAAGINGIKLDNVARDVDDIKHLLQKIGLPSQGYQSTTGSSGQRDIPKDERPSHESIPLRDHSAHVINFVKAVVNGVPTQPNSTRVTASLKCLLHSVEVPDSRERLPPAQGRDQFTMPQSDHVVVLIRWAKDHRTYARVMWICRILPLEMFENICRKVFFATGEYTIVDLILVNSFLSYMFGEHAVIYGDDRSQSYCDLCRSNLSLLLQLLPLVLPVSMEVIAALVFGLLHYVEEYKATRSWALISSALSLCQTLGYHRPSSIHGVGDSHRKAQERLFWTVFSCESTLSLRLGRRSGISDFEIALLVDPAEPRSLKVSRIARKAYQHLHSASSVNEPTKERLRWALELSNELRKLINETRAEISEAPYLANAETDPLKILYLRADMVCHSSLLVLILRAIPAATGTGIDDCVTAARETLDLHQECMENVRCYKNPLLVTKYITWVIIHTPFVSFTILYTRVVQLFDLEDLARLDAFAASLKPSTGTETHLSLYELLCQSARIYIDSKWNLDAFNQTQSLNFDNEILPGEEVGGAALFGPAGSYYGDQLMSVLDEDVRF